MKCKEKLFSGRLAVILFVTLLSYCLTPENCLLAQEGGGSNEPFTVDEIAKLLENGAQQSEIIKQIEENKVDFELTRDVMKRLLKLDAEDALLDAIEANLHEPLQIIAPKNGHKAGATIRLEGRSQVFEGKHLWLFAHVEGLSVWWPQRGEIKLKEEGAWVQGAYLGGPQDIGFDFEIKVMWVSKKVHTQMVNYLAAGERTGSYPGIPLPEGDPAAQITVRKVSH